MFSHGVVVQVGSLDPPCGAVHGRCATVLITWISVKTVFWDPYWCQLQLSMWGRWSGIHIGASYNWACEGASVAQEVGCSTGMPYDYQGGSFHCVLWGVKFAANFAAPIQQQPASWKAWPRVQALVLSKGLS